MTSPLPIPSLDDLRAARTRIAGHAAVTPLLHSPALDAAVGGTVLVKAEVLQHTGSFKLRGALNRTLQIPAADRQRGVGVYLPAAAARDAQEFCAVGRAVGDVGFLRAGFAGRTTRYA